MSTYDQEDLRTVYLSVADVHTTKQATMALCGRLQELEFELREGVGLNKTTLVHMLIDDIEHTTRALELLGPPTIAANRREYVEVLKQSALEALNSIVAVQSPQEHITDPLAIMYAMEDTIEI